MESYSKVDWSGVYYDQNGAGFEKKRKRKKEKEKKEITSAVFSNPQKKKKGTIGLVVVVPV